MVQGNSTIITTGLNLTNMINMCANCLREQLGVMILTIPRLADCCFNQPAYDYDLIEGSYSVVRVVIHQWAQLQEPHSCKKVVHLLLD